MKANESVNRWLKMTALVMGLAVLGGCGTWSGGTTAAERDLFEMKNNLNKYIEQQGQTNHELQFKLDSLNESLENRDSVTRASIDDMQKRINDQIEQNSKISQKLDVMQASLENIAQRVTSQPVGSVIQPGASGFVDSGAASPTPPPSFATWDQGLALGLRQYNSNDFAGAIDTLKRVMEMNPPANRATEVRFWFARSLQGAGQAPEAIDAFWTLINADNKSPYAWESLEYVADLLQSQGNSAEAAKWYQKIVTDYPSYPEANRVKQKLTALPVQ